MRIHMHQDDAPAALALIHAVVGDRPHRFGEIKGLEPTAVGMFVDPERVAESYLSTTEVATIKLAVVVWMFERQGPPPERIAAAIASAIESVIR